MDDDCGNDDHELKYKGLDQMGVRINKTRIEQRCPEVRVSVDPGVHNLCTAYVCDSVFVNGDRDRCVALLWIL